jgi:hypothetical protein
MAERRWAKRVTRTQVRIRNHRGGKSAKITIRHNVLDAIGRTAHVFDAYAGSGEMFREVWHHAAGYVGCDTEWCRDGRTLFVCDNRRVMRAIDLNRFSIFDFDAFGSAWHQMLILSARRAVQADERIGIVFTDGTLVKLKQGGLPNAMAVAAGMTGKISGLQRWRDDIIQRAIYGVAKRIGCTVERQWQAEGTSKAKVLYVGLVLRGNAVADPVGKPVVNEAVAADG